MNRVEIVPGTRLESCEKVPRPLLIAVPDNPEPQTEIDDEGLRQNAKRVLQAMQNGLEQFQRLVIQTTLEILSWIIIILIVVVFAMYGIGIVKSCVQNGIRSPVTAAVAWALPLMIIDFIRYFARVFGLLDNPQRPLNPLAVRWQQIVFDAAYQA